GRGLGVDDQLELGRLLDWKIGWLGPLEDAAGVEAYLAIHFRDVSPVTHQPADFGNVAGTGCHGDRMARRHSGQLQPPTDEKSILRSERGSRGLAQKICEGGFVFAVGVGLENLDLRS